ncbi:hypothetical protein V9T40_010266 [Parthenolecanium corni]|uniref:Uncharacterized protein n=1 Tax=Parthenolecanium corni TaxID=536013 RepID=A0AAN9TC44_9HEMI
MTPPDTSSVKKGHRAKSHEQLEVSIKAEINIQACPSNEITLFGSSNNVSSTTNNSDIQQITRALMAAMLRVTV